MDKMLRLKEQEQEIRKFLFIQRDTCRGTSIDTTKPIVDGRGFQPGTTLWVGKLMENATVPAESSLVRKILGQEACTEVAEI